MSLEKITIKVPPEFAEAFRERSGDRPAHRVQALERVVEREGLAQAVELEQAQVAAEGKLRMRRKRQP